MGIPADDLMHHCDFCVLAFDSLKKRNEHTLGHFQQKLCATCNVPIINIAGYWYQRHVGANCADANDEQVCSDDSSIYACSLSAEEPTTIKVELGPVDIIEAYDNESAKEHSDDLYSDSNAHICELCSDIFDDEHELMDHQKLCGKHSKTPYGKLPTLANSPGASGAIANLEKYTCTLCQQTFKAKKELRYHVRVQHTRHKIACELCSKKFDDKHELMDHQKLCGKRPKNPYGKLPTLANSLGGSGAIVNLNKLTCTQCQQTFEAERELRYHVRMQHTGHKIACELCSKMFDDEHGLMHHQKLCGEYPKLPYGKLPTLASSAGGSGAIANLNKSTCTLCQQTFEAEEELRCHVRVQHTGHGIACEGQCTINGCTRVFASDSMLARHLDAHQWMTCDICQKRARGKSLMRQHMRSHRSQAGEKYTCPDCGEVFSAKFRFECHAMIHSGGTDFKCQYDGCSRVFRFKRNFDEHNEVHERLLNDPAAKELYCQTCDKLMKTQSLFARHKCLKFICYYCGKEFRRMSLLKEHLNSHTGAKPYECDVCKKTFSRYFNLKRHTMIHSGKKPYVCRECGQAFNQNNEMHRHRFKAHGIFKRKFPCTFCEQVFPENSLLRRHLGSHGAV